jgi:hypothetical protein
VGISALGGTGSRLITKSGASAAILLPNSTGLSANTGTADQGYGSWTQLVASTGAEYLLTGVTARTSSSVSTSTRSDPIIVDLGIGGSGSETAVATVPLFGSDYAASTSVIYGGSRDIAVPVRVPAGTRIAFRVALYLTNGTATPIVVIAHAVPYANVEGN